ncbi:hypothetical protein GGR55DRAFT_689292 [Xylaria sp. FL0064]|nr:hypothetical protein GGR55DRAFT_689292 [Xylaria sp. FL0064]
MDHPTIPIDDITVPTNRAALQKNEHDPSDEGSTAGVDRKTKKRIQNRVAQRTYRTRIKQRLQDLQQQVHQLQQKDGEKQHNIQPSEIEADDGGAEGVAFYTSYTRNPTIPPLHGNSRDPFNLEMTSQDIPGMKSTDSSPWAGIPSQTNTWNSPLGGDNFIYNPSPMRTRPPVNFSSGFAPQSLSPPRLSLDLPNSILCSPTCQGEAQRDTLVFSGGNKDNPRGLLNNQTGNIHETDEDGDICHSHGFNSPHTSPWGQKLESKTSSNDCIAARHVGPAPQQGFYQDRITHASMTAVPTQWPGNMPSNQQAAMEQQFEYVLNCAQHAGFDSFDTMALQYYTQNFHPSSALALEQRLSRNRRLPELLAELRKQSTTWSALQRRGYQDEALKAAEEICIMELNDFHRSKASRSDTDDASERLLADMLPNLWVLLTRIVSSNSQLSQRQISEAVFMSMSILCGLGSSQIQPVGSSTYGRSPI